MKMHSRIVFAILILVSGFVGAEEQVLQIRATVNPTFELMDQLERHILEHCSSAGLSCYANDRKGISHITGAPAISIFVHKGSSLKLVIQNAGVGTILSIVTASTINKLSEEDKTIFKGFRCLLEEEFDLLFKEYTPPKQLSP